MSPPLVVPTLALALSCALPGGQALAAAPPPLVDGVVVQVQVLEPAGDLVPESEVVAEATATLSSALVPGVSATAGRGVATLTLEPGIWRLTARRDG